MPPEAGKRQCGWTVKFSIKIKILSALFLISILTFGIVSFYSIHEMRRLGETAMKYGNQVGMSAVSDTKNGLIRQAKEELQALAEDQAYITELNLKRIAAQVENLAGFCSFGNGVPPHIPDHVLFTEESSVHPGNAGNFSSFSLAPGVNLKDVKSEISALARLHNLLKFIQFNDPYIRLIYIGTQNGVIYRYPWSASKRDYDPRTRAWYTGAVTAKGKLFWSQPYWSASRMNELTVTCSKALYGKDGKLLGVIGADVSVKSITQDFISTQAKRGTHSFLINSEGEVIAGGRIHELITGSWDQSAKMPSLMNDRELEALCRKMLELKPGTATITVNGMKQIAGYAPVKACSWSIALVQAETETLKPAFETEAEIHEDKLKAEHIMNEALIMNIRIFMGFSLFMLAIILFIGYMLAKHLSNPIRQLITGAKKIGAGHLDWKLELKTGDEIEELSDTFNSMARDLKNYIRNLNNAAREKQRIESELKAATEIQTSMLPRRFPPFPDRTDVDVYAMMEPAKEVGGDLYDFVFIDENRLFFAVGDVAGKGIPAALFMATAKTLMRGFAQNGLSPAQILHLSNNYLADENDTCMFITVFCGILDCRTGMVTYANGGHNPPVIIRRDGNSSFLKMVPGFPLGPFEMELNGVYVEGQFLLEPGDSLFAYTDGVTEAVNPKEELFGEGRLSLALAVAPPVPGTDLKTAVDTVRRIVREHAGGTPQSDDITMLLIRYNGKK